MRGFPRLLVLPFLRCLGGAMNGTSNVEDKDYDADKTAFNHQQHIHPSFDDYT